MFRAILRNIKQDTDNGAAPTETITKEVLREIKAQVSAGNHRPTESDISTAVAAVVSSRLNLGNEGTERVKALMEFLLQNPGQ